MLNSAVPATASLHTSTSSATHTPASPTRSGRLRGLSYLRNYTRDHLAAVASSQGSREDSSAQSRRRRSSEGLVAGAANNPPLSTPAIRDREVGKNTRRREGSIEQERELDETFNTGDNGLLLNGEENTVDNKNSSTAIASPRLNVGYTTTTGSANMTRSRAATAQPRPTPTTQSAQSWTPGEGPNPFPTPEGMPTNQSSTTETISAPWGSGTVPKDSSQQPTIRFIPHIETRSTRPSLNFTAITRTLPQASSVVRVGRYSERDTHNNQQTNNGTSVTPVGFKSKVVSRRHCEFWYSNSQWYVRDVKSSSGTFLNHVRLSSPGVESRPFPVNDGDVVQLGIDFKGGEEVIFRCVKIRVECNRGWQKGLNSFNTNAHKALLKSTGAAGGAEQKTGSAAKAKRRETDTASATSSECAICLNPVAPCQALFVAPCSHVWHYKCIRNLIHGPSWPNFLCPNCRYVADLDADVEAPDDYVEDVEEMIEDEEIVEERIGGDEIPIAIEPDDEEGAAEPRPRTGRTVEEAADMLRERYPNRRIESIPDEELAALLGRTFSSLGSRGRSATEVDHTQVLDPDAIVLASQPVELDTTAGLQSSADAGAELEHARSTTPTSSAQFALAAGVMNMNGRASGSRQSDKAGVVTPSNDFGAFVLDGIASRVGGMSLEDDR